MRLGELLKLDVVTESGLELGRVYDVRIQLRRGRASVVALAVGATGLRKRLAGNDQRDQVPGEYVPWEDVVRLERGTVVVRRDRRR